MMNKQSRGSRLVVKSHAQRRTGTMRRAQRAMRAAAAKRTSTNEFEVISRTEAILRKIELAACLVMRSHLRLMNLERKDLVQEATVVVIRNRGHLLIVDSEDMPSRQWFISVVRNTAR